MKLIPYGKHFIDKEDINFVSRSIQSQYLTGGNYEVKFKNKLKKYLGSKYLELTSSGTASLSLAFLAIDIKKNDIVIMPSINFIAAYNMANKLNAKIYLADVEKNTGQMTPETVEDCIKKNKLKKIKCVVTMYLGGYPENVIEFYKLKKKYNCFLIEDACHAFGASYYIKSKKYMIGSCSHSDIATFSFHPVKTIASGEGGCITTNNLNIKKKIQLLRSHGIKKNVIKHWDYDVLDNGYNYRLSDINCALGLSQLKKINKFLKNRRKIANLYKLKLKKYNQFITFPKYKNKDKCSANHLLVVKINFEKLLKNKEDFFLYMKKNKIICQFHYIPIFNFNIFKKKKIYNKLIGANEYSKQCLSLPLFYNLKEDEINYIVKKIINFFENYNRIN